MDMKIDKKTRDALLDALQKAQEYSQQQEVNRERQLWKKINLPCTLSDTMHGLSKNDMDKIRRNFEFKSLSALRKGELASALENLIPKEFKQIIYRLDQGRYGLVKNVVVNSGVIADPGISITEAESLLGYCILFPGLFNNQKVLFMPKELVNIFLQIDGAELAGIIERNTEWIRLTQGMLYYYGVVDVWIIKEKIEKLTGKEIDVLEFINVIAMASNYYDQINFSDYGLRNHRVLDARKIIGEHKMRASVPFYSFSKQQLLDASEPDYLDRTPAMNNFISFLERRYELKDQDKNEIAIKLADIINLDAKPSAIIQYLQTCFEIPSFDFAQQLTAMIMELYNNTRQWALKGHTPNELAQTEKKNFKPLPSEPFKMYQADSNVVDIKTGKKVGRNDPCPCGSGKKFKKCCGRTT